MELLTCECSEGGDSTDELPVDPLDRPILLALDKVPEDLRDSKEASGAGKILVNV